MVGVSLIASGTAALLLRAGAKGWRWSTKGDGTGSSSTLLYLWGILLETPPSDPPLSVSLKVLTAWWFLTCLVLTAAYKSSLAAHFTVGVQAAPVDSFEDLVGRSGWRWGSEKLGGASLYFFASSSDPVTRAVYARLETHSLDENMRLVLAGRYAFITTQLQSAYQVASRYTDARGYSPIHTGAKRYPKFAGTSWGFRIGAPCHGPITHLTQRLIEGGLIRYWLGDVVVTRVRRERREGTTQLQVRSQSSGASDESEGQSEVVVSMAHLEAAFYFLLVGLAFSGLVFSGEVLTRRLQPCRFARPHPD
ncbi:uncharacterized protein LOC126984006 isoform X2 [Eriocheir sinensis]|uniref:uncharacterized protein LOC126984006 isoform X2 n=1 Tax=Eriocheir sinensis TaxID=95602 RepID=UPI0021C5BF9F|nr:uncharacterized protein LOC126984006 isoform X2 [Eriocheir sinensis]